MTGNGKTSEHDAQKVGRDEIVAVCQTIISAKTFPIVSNFTNYYRQQNYALCRRSERQINCHLADTFPRRPISLELKTPPESEPGTTIRNDRFQCFRNR